MAIVSPADKLANFILPTPVDGITTTAIKQTVVVPNDGGGAYGTSAVAKAKGGRR